MTILKDVRLIPNTLIKWRISPTIFNLNVLFYKTLLLTLCLSFSQLTNAAYGDPGPDGWVKCANESEECHYNPTSKEANAPIYFPWRKKSIRYGIPGQWTYRHNQWIGGSGNGIICNIQFDRSDPAPNQPKKCY